LHPILYILYNLPIYGVLCGGFLEADGRVYEEGFKDSKKYE
jgi:hypothetical protein